jgi:hypothetical protein
VKIKMNDIKLLVGIVSQKIRERLPGTGPDDVNFGGKTGTFGDVDERASNCTVTDFSRASRRPGAY